MDRQTEHQEGVPTPPSAIPQAESLQLYQLTREQLPELYQNVRPCVIGNNTTTIEERRAFMRNAMAEQTTSATTDMIVNWGGNWMSTLAPPTTEALEITPLYLEDIYQESYPAERKAERLREVKRRNDALIRENADNQRASLQEQVGEQIELGHLIDLMVIEPEDEEMDTGEDGQEGNTGEEVQGTNDVDMDVEMTTADPSNYAAVEDAPMYDAPVDDAPADDAPADDAPVDDDPVDDMPIYDAPVDDTSVGDAPVNTVAVGNVPVNTAAVGNAPVNNAAVDDAALPRSRAANDDDSVGYDETAATGMKRKRA